MLRVYETELRDCQVTKQITVGRGVFLLNSALSGE
jgi:hypothetical protein